MAYFVYIIQSLKDESFYKGYSKDVRKRLAQHNEGETTSTRFKRPWKLVYVEECPSKTGALKRERALKKANKKRIARLINSPLNILSKI